MSSPPESSAAASRLFDAGREHERRGDARAALEAYAQALAHDPGFIPAHKHLAALHFAHRRFEEASACLEKALRIAPDDAALWLVLAGAQTNRGDAAAALASLGHAVRTAPGQARFWKDIGHLYGEHWRFEEADRALARAAELDPDDSGLASLRGVVKQELDDTAGALEVLGRARARFADDLGVVMGERLLLPQIYADAGELARWRRRYSEGLAALVGETDRWLPRAAQVFDLERTSFLLAYQGENDRELQRDYSGFLARLAGAAAPQWRRHRPWRYDGGRRLRVGFAGSIFRDCTAGRYFERWITGLEAAHFERIVFHMAPAVDHFTRRISQASDRLVSLRGGARATIETLLEADLDILVYPEVGMSFGTSLLTALRLAPLQVVGWGHPVTTGSAAVDAFFTCAEMEPQDAASHYVEPLVRLPGIGVEYAMPEPQPPATRESFGLPCDRRLYVCAQSLFKIHPEMDALFADIVAADDSAVIAFFHAPARAITDKFARRLQGALAARGVAPRGQVKFLPRMAGTHFRRLLALADVVLDTTRWSGGNTSLDAFAAGAPVVTLPGEFMRGRQTAAMLCALGLEELVVASPAEYARSAIAIASDSERNARLRHAIAGRRGVLFERRDATAAFQEALLDLAAQASRDAR